jgi:hypothetical protein
MKLDYQDLRWALVRLPKNLKKIMEDPEWHNKIFVGGGYLRSIVSNEPINDVDVFVGSEKDAELLAHKLAFEKKDIVKTDNAYTIRGKMPIQIIYRWLFEQPEDVSNSFDFTVCCAVFYYTWYKPEKVKVEDSEPQLIKKWDSYCDERFYIDLASKRLVYRHPVRNEDAGGSMLRVLKYYQKGYRIPLDSLGGVIARLVKSINENRIDIHNEQDVAKVVTGLLREVDPNIDPLHQSHLPSGEDLPELPEQG